MGEFHSRGSASEEDMPHKNMQVFLEQCLTHFCAKLSKLADVQRKKEDKIKLKN